jgi:hypothetical protein
LIDATGVYPKVSQAVAPSLFPAEPDLVIANLALASTIFQVSEGDLLLRIIFLSVRKYGVLGNIVEIDLGQAELAIIVIF